MSNKNVTWEELADDNDSYHSSRGARTRPMEDIFAWAVGQKEK